MGFSIFNCDSMLLNWHDIEKEINEKEKGKVHGVRPKTEYGSICIKFGWFFF